MQGFKVDSATFAHYRREFEIPAFWKNQEVVLRFDGVHSEYKVLVNGKQVGQHMGGMTPYEVNITHAINSGKNKLELYVRSESLADMLGSLTQYAAHQLGGITRKVTLFAIPKVHISDLRIITDLDSLYQNASLKMKIAVTNKTGQTLKDIRLQAALQGTLLAATDTLPALQPDGMWKGEIEMHVERPDLWDPEHPNLYKLQIGLYIQDKQQELLTRNIGFREVRIQVYLTPKIASHLQILMNFTLNGTTVTKKEEPKQIYDLGNKEKSKLMYKTRMPGNSCIYVLQMPAESLLMNI